MKKYILGRGVFAGIVISFMATVVVMLGLTHHSQAKASGCDGSVVTHTVVIKNDMVSPQFTDGKLCDKLTILNQDNVTREIAFGPHEVHVPYDGVAERFLNQKQSFTLTLNKVGMFHFHDHIHDEVMGYFNVYKN